MKSAVNLDKMFDFNYIQSNGYSINPKKNKKIKLNTNVDLNPIFPNFATIETVKTIDKMDNLVYGIDTHMSLKENSNIKNLLIIPFQEYRNPPGSKFPD